MLVTYSEYDYAAIKNRFSHIATYLILEAIFCGPKNLRDPFLNFFAK